MRTGDRPGDRGATTSGRAGTPSRRPPDEQVQVVLPRVADAAVDLDAVLQAAPGRVARRGLGHVTRTRSVVVGRVDGHRRVLHRRGRASSASARSASLCWMAWNDPMGTSNCLRSLAYSSVMSKSRRAVPTISAASATWARSRHACHASGESATDSPRRPREVDLVAATGGVDGPDLTQGHRCQRGEDAYRRTGLHHRDAVGEIGVDDEVLDRLGVRGPLARSSGDRDGSRRLAGDERVERGMVDRREQRRTARPSRRTGRARRRSRSARRRRRGRSRHRFRARRTRGDGSTAVRRRCDRSCARAGARSGIRSRATTARCLAAALDRV